MYVTDDSRGQEHQLETSIGTIIYRDTGFGDPGRASGAGVVGTGRDTRARTFVFVHGYLVDGELWRDVVPLLTAQGHRCITPDLPLGAHRIAANTPPTARNVAGAVRELIAQLELSDVVLVGNDSGGAIGQMLVTSSTDRIAGLALTPCDMYDKFPPFPYNLAKVFPRLGPLAPIVYRLAATRPMRWVAFGPLVGGISSAELTKHWYAPGLKDRAVQNDGHHFIGSADGRELNAASEKMEQLELPTAFVWPRGCHFFRFRVAESMASKMPNGTLYPLEKGETFVSLQHPGLVADALAEFNTTLPDQVLK